MEESKNEKVLTSIYQNTRTALQSIDDILPNIKNDRLADELARQSSEYNIIQEECEMLAKSEDFNIKDINWFERIKLWSSIKISSMIDKSTQNVSEMLLLGTFMGYISCIKDINDNIAVENEIINLSKKLMEIEKENIEKLKEFL